MIADTVNVGVLRENGLIARRSPPRGITASRIGPAAS
jgi:hypothetical protein